MRMALLTSAKHLHDRTQVNAQNSFSGATPLHCAAQENDRGDKEGRVLAIKMLLAAGADATIQVQTCEEKQALRQE